MFSSSQAVASRFRGVHQKPCSVGVFCLPVLHRIYARVLSTDIAFIKDALNQNDPRAWQDLFREIFGKLPVTAAKGLIPSLPT
jgi:hypothetical protein